MDKDKEPPCPYPLDLLFKRSYPSTGSGRTVGKSIVVSTLNQTIIKKAQVFADAQS